MNINYWNNTTVDARFNFLNTNWTALNSGSRWDIPQITYSFLTDADGRAYEPYLPAGETLDFSPFGAFEMEFTRFLMDYLESFIALDFIEVSGNQGQIGFGKHNMTPGGYADPPSGSGNIGVFLASDLLVTKYGDFSLSTITHELGHGLGLSHPRNYDNAARSNPELAASDDTGVVSIMTYNGWNYNDGSGAGYPPGYAPLDLHALQSIYGSSNNTDNNSFVLDSSSTARFGKSGTTWTIPTEMPFVIVDTGGTDTIDASNADFPSSGDTVIFTFDAGLFLTSGISGVIYNNSARTWDTISNPLSIPVIDILPGTVIELFSGTAGTDQVIGNALGQSISTNGGADTITGAGGNDTIDGGSGIDTAVFSGTRAEYAVFTTSGGQTMVADAVAGRDGKDRLVNLENLTFGSDTVSVDAALVEPADPDGSAYQVYRFYNAQTGAHFFTTSSAERNSILENIDVFSYEGNVFDSNVTSATGSAVYRFYNTETGIHFYTASAAEADSIRQNLSHFNEEGISYYASLDESTGGTALFRFYNTQTGSHFYTTSATERDGIIATLGHYNYEGVAYYVDLA